MRMCSRDWTGSLVIPVRPSRAVAVASIFWVMASRGILVFGAAKVPRMDSGKPVSLPGV